MNFKDKLNEYLKITNCSSKELSTLSNISETVISRYRNGQRVPKTNSKQLKSISGALEKIIKDKILHNIKMLTYMKNSLNLSQTMIVLTTKYLVKILTN